MNFSINLYLCFVIIAYLVYVFIFIAIFDRFQKPRIPTLRKVEARVSEKKIKTKKIDNLIILHTRYYVKFAVENGFELTFELSEKDYNFLKEKDRGKLSYQGDEFIEFLKY